MKLEEIMQAQIDSAIKGLMRVRAGLGEGREPDERTRIGHDLEWVASHIEDIRHNWGALQDAGKRRGETRGGFMTAALLCEMPSGPRD